MAVRAAAARRSQVDSGAVWSRCFSDPRFDARAARVFLFAAADGCGPQAVQFVLKEQTYHAVPADAEDNRALRLAVAAGGVDIVCLLLDFESVALGIPALSQANLVSLFGLLGRHRRSIPEASLLSCARAASRSPKSTAAACSATCISVSSLAAAAWARRRAVVLAWAAALAED